MKLNRVQMKRAFVTANRAKKCKNLQLTDFKDCIDIIRKEISGFSENDLDKHIETERLKRFNNHNWRLNKCTINEIGVWPRMGDGLPPEWCEGSVQETAAHIKKFLKERNPIHKTPEILKSIKKIQSMLRVAESLKEIPIVILPGGLHRRRCRTTWDIDDGSFRAVALALKGQEKIEAWIGSPRHQRSSCTAEWEDNG